MKNSRFGWFLFALVAAFYCYEYVLRIAPGALSAELMQHYGLSATAFGNLFAVYYYIYTPMQIPVGVLLDRYKTRILLTLATLLCAGGTFIFAGTSSLGIAQLGRFLVGLGSAFGFVGVMKVASLWLPANRLGMIAGLTTTLGMLGGIIGNNLMAFWVQTAGWQALMYVSGGFGLLLALVMAYFLPNSSPSAEKKEVAPLTMSSLIGPMSLLLKSRQLWLAALCGGILYTSLSVFAELWGVPYLQIKGFSPTSATALISMIFLGWALGGPLIGLISDRFNDRRLPLLWGSLLGALCIALVIFVDGLGPLSIATLLFLFGAFSSAENLCFVLAKESTLPSLAASAIALTNTFVMLAGTILQPLVGLILDLTFEGGITNGVHLYTQTNFQYALLALPLLYLASAALSLLLKPAYAPAPLAPVISE